MKNLKNKFLKILNKELSNKINILDLSISLKEAGLLLKSNINTSETIRLLSLTATNKKLKNIFLQVYNSLLMERSYMWHLKKLRHLIIYFYHF